MSARHSAERRGVLADGEYQTCGCSGKEQALPGPGQKARDGARDGVQVLSWDLESQFLRRGGVWRESTLHCQERGGLSLHFHRGPFG